MSDELNEYTSNRVEAGQLRQAVVSGSAFLRPSDSAELCDALENGETCEVPNRYMIKVFGAMAFRNLSAEIEQDRETKGWTVVIPHCR
jgi:hypothetical protein